MYLGDCIWGLLISIARALALPALHRTALFPYPYRPLHCPTPPISPCPAGLGKSLTTITFLHLLFTYRPEGRVLVVLPANVLYNFFTEFGKWLPEDE